MSAYNASGQINLTVVNGSTYTGRYAPDGSTYIVLNDGTAYTGFAHPCGAINAVVTTDTSSWGAPNGSMYVINTTDGYHPTSPGNVLLLDNATSITVFAGGATSVSNLVPFFIPLGMISVSGAWKVTTGSNVSVIGIGNFT